MLSEHDKALAKFLLYTKLATFSVVSDMTASLLSDKEDVELWALNSLRAYGEIAKRWKGTETEKVECDLIIALLEEA